MNVVQLTVRLSLCSAVVTAVTDNAGGHPSDQESQKIKCQIKEHLGCCLVENEKMSSFPINGN